MNYFEQAVKITKAAEYDRLRERDTILREIRDSLIDALELAMKQLDDPDEDIGAIRENAQAALERAKRV
jgi:hypothetical protein